jgi:pimeloyl-ACP methyl ester carboxylesterase
MTFLLTFLAILLTLFIVAVLAAVVCSVVVRRRYRMQPPADEIYAVSTPDNWKLRIFRHKPKHGAGEPVLLVPGISANHYEFEFPRGASMVDTLTQAGYDCWILDPRGRRSSTPPFGKHNTPVTFDDHLIHDLPAAVDFVRAATRYENVHYIGHSLGGMLLYAYDAAYGRDNIASAVTIGSPLGFEHVTYRSPRGLFLVMKAARPVVEFFVRAAAPLWSKLKIRSRLLPINWSNLHPAVGGRETYHILEVPPLRLVQDLDRIARDKVWRMHGEQVDVVEGLRELDVPLFAVYGTQDPFTPRIAYETFFEQLDSDDKRILVLSKENDHSADYNHIDLVLGRNSREELFEPIVEWLRAHPSCDRLSPVRTAPEMEAEAAATGTPEEEMADYVAQSRGELEAHNRPKRTVTTRKTTTKIVIDIPEPEDIPEDLDVPVLPGASNEELARLAKQLQEDTDALAAARKAAPKKKPAAKKPAPAKAPLKKKPAAKRKPKP